MLCVAEGVVLAAQKQNLSGSDAKMTREGDGQEPIIFLFLTARVFHVASFTND